MNLDIDRKTVEALLHGQGCATSLKSLLQNPEISSVSTEQLLNTILDSFSFALSFLDSPLKSSSKKTIKIGGVKGTEHYRDDSPNPRLEDGFIWRKYGQKTIKTSPYQRCYYRCSYAKDRNCNATKRVQKIKDNPPVYRTTYVGQHVCEVEVTDDTYGSKMMRFDHVGEDNTTNHIMPYATSDSVRPQLASIDNQAIAMEDDVMNFINEVLMEDEQFSVSDVSLISPEEDMMFLDNIPASD